MTFFGLSERDEEISREKYGFNELSYISSFGKKLLAGFGGLSCRLFAAAAMTEVVAALVGLNGFADITVSFKRIALFAAAAVFCGLAEALALRRSEKLLNGYEGGRYTVFRSDGMTADIPCRELAVGDAVFLSAGDRVPADGAVAEGTVTVDRSAFGILGKAEKVASPQDLRRAVSRGMNDPYFVYGGSEVCGGNGIIKITAVGKNTRAAEKIGEKAVKISGESFSGIIHAGTAIASVAAAAAFVYCIFSGLSGGNIADGLAHGASCAAAVMAVSGFFGKNIICESAAAGTVNSLHKKGSDVLNPNVLVSAADTDTVLIERSGMIAEAEYSSKAAAFIDGTGKEYGSFGKVGGRLADAFKKAVISTSEAVVVSGTPKGGSPLDRALYSFIGKSAENLSEIKKQAEVHSEAENLLSGATVTIDGKLVTFVRGGAEILLDRCSDSLDESGKRQKITNRSALLKLAETLSLTSGKDIVALALTERGIKGGRLPSGGYTLIGLVALNPLFFDVAAEETERLEKSGVKAILVTAESRESAIYAAKRSNIKKSGGVVISSEQLAKMSDKELGNKIDSIRAVVRAVPSDKRRLIRAAREKGKKVCVSVSGMKDVKASAEADWIFASPGCGTAAEAVSDAAAKGCGIKAIADIVSFSAKYKANCKARIIIRAVCAAAAAVVLIFI